MDLLERDIRLYNIINNNSNVNNNEVEQKEGIIIVNTHKIKYREYMNNDEKTIFFIAAGKRPCFVLTILENSATLQSLERGNDCFVEFNEKSKDLVIAAYKLAVEKGATSFTLTDNSYIYCNRENKSNSNNNTNNKTNKKSKHRLINEKVHLSDLSFLTTGKTWYESILPFKPIEIYDIENSRLKVDNNSWFSVITKAEEKGYNLELDIE